jgi:seryl-tRNA synthetase
MSRPLSREIQDAADGRLLVTGRALRVLEWLDAELESLAVENGATMLRVPTVIARETLDRAGYFEAFGDAATPAGPGETPRYLLTPAMCYHAYPTLAGRRLDANAIFGCAGRCFRRETAPARSLARLWEFTMREVIFVGTRAWVEDERRRWMTLAGDFASSLGLAGRLEVASDPFFAGGLGQKLIQQLKELKFELKTRVGTEDEVEAVASFNLHETFFGRRFGITTADGAPAWTGCVAFGLERWLLAVVAQGRLDQVEARAVAR